MANDPKRFTTPAPKSVEWYRKGVPGGGQRDTIFNRLKAKLTGGKDESGTSYFKLHDRKLSKSDADTIIANMKQDMDGYPMFSTGSTSGEDEREYQEWIIARYLDAPTSKSSKPSKTTKSSSGTTSVYKPADKFVDDKKEFTKEQERKLDEKLEETSDKILDAIDELIAADKKRFEDFKKQQQKDSTVKKRTLEVLNNLKNSKHNSVTRPKGQLKRNPEFGYNQYESPIGPLPMFGPKAAKKGLIGTREILNDDQIAKKYGIDKPAPVPAWGKDKKGADEDDWESEVNDQLGTKLDELIEQVRSEPLPQPNKTKRRKTRGKKPLERKKYPGKMGLGGSLQEIQENVIETRKALFELYKLEKERFEFKKKIDAKITQELSAKLREKDLEKPEKKKEKKEEGREKKKKKEGGKGKRRKRGKKEGRRREREKKRGKEKRKGGEREIDKGLIKVKI